MKQLDDLGHYGKTIKFAAGDERDAFLADLFDENIVQRRLGSDRVVGTYDIARYGFEREFRRLILEKGLARARDLDGIPGLSNLHEILPSELTDLDDTELNNMSKAFYDTDEAFLETYRCFIKDVLSPLFGTELWFQATPTIRFHFPRQKGFNWKTRYHSDIMLGHPPQEVNIWLPVTRTFGTNSMRIAGRGASMEAIAGCGFDFDELALKVQRDETFQQHCAAITAPVELLPGEFLIFDPRCLHATQYNDTEATRISIDFRVVAVADHARMRLPYRGTGRRRMLFAPGHYYDMRSSSHLDFGDKTL